VAANGLVSVDAFESIEFSNKTALTINGKAGDDVIELNNAATPTAWPRSTSTETTRRRATR